MKTWNRVAAAVLAVLMAAALMACGSGRKEPAPAQTSPAPAASTQKPEAKPQPAAKPEPDKAEEKPAEEAAAPAGEPKPEEPAPAEEAPPAEEPEEEPTAAEEIIEAVEEAVIDPVFKAVMDEYEEFMDRYAAFMKDYKESGNSITMLTDYLKLLEEYGDWIEKIDGLDENSMNSAELAYYIEVNARVQKKLLEAI